MLCDISDHFPILFCIDLRPSKSRNQLSMTSRLIYEKTITCFGESSISYDWSEILLHCSNINDSSSAYETFTRNYTMLYEKSFPIHENKLRNSGKIRQPWMTSGLLKSCNQKSRLYLKYLKPPSDSNRTNFNRYRNTFKELRNEAERFLQCKYSLAKAWKIIKAMLNSGNSITVD